MSQTLAKSLTKKKRFNFKLVNERQKKRETLFRYLLLNSEYLMPQNCGSSKEESEVYTAPKDMSGNL